MLWGFPCSVTHRAHINVFHICIIVTVVKNIARSAFVIARAFGIGTFDHICVRKCRVIFGIFVNTRCDRLFGVIYRCFRNTNVIPSKFFILIAAVTTIVYQLFIRLFIVIGLTDLMRRIFLKPIFCRVNKYVSWLLKSYWMMTVRMINLIYSSFIDKFMGCKKLWLFGIFKDTNFNDEIFLPIRTLNLINIKLCLQSMIHLIVLCKKIVDNLNNWIVVCECGWIWLNT